MDEKVAKRFWAKVDKGGPGECWLWRTPDKEGYGSLSIGGRQVRAHRLLYVTLGYNLPDGYVLDHVCRNRACVNPAHLRPVTVGQNTLENSLGLAAANKQKTECVRGHPLIGHNLWIKPDGKRRCRLCDNAWNKAYYERRKAMRAEPC